MNTDGNIRETTEWLTTRPGAGVAGCVTHGGRPGINAKTRRRKGATKEDRRWRMEDGKVASRAHTNLAKIARFAGIALQRGRGQGALEKTFV